MVKIAIIDECGFWRGMVPDTPEVRVHLKKKGFEICPRGKVATKQYMCLKKEV